MPAELTGIVLFSGKTKIYASQCTKSNNALPAGKMLMPSFALCPSCRNVCVKTVTNDSTC